MFVKRLLSGIVLIVYLIIGNFNMTCMGILLAFLTSYGFVELYTVLNKGLFRAPSYISILGILGIYGINYFKLLDYNSSYVLCAFLVTIFCFIFYVLAYPKYELSEVLTAIFSYIYLSLISSLYPIRELNDGFYLIWMVFIASWGADTLAYCTGMLFGKHKLSKVLSPKKSIEGALGGVIGSTLLSLLYSYLLYKNQLVNFESIYLYPLITFFASIISIFGDLFASAIKRHYDIKDYGNLIPGHGGIMDRFDSVILVAPVIYIIILIRGIL